MRPWTATVGSFWEERTLDALAFLETRPSARRLHRAAAAAGDAVSRFHRAGGRHPDLHLKNLLLRERGAGFEAIVVDLDRVRCAARVGPARRMAELMRLYRSLLKRGVLQQVGVRGCAAFFHAYVAGDRELRHALLRRLPRERRRVAMHALLYRARP